MHVRGCTPNLGVVAQGDEEGGFGGGLRPFLATQRPSDSRPCPCALSPCLQSVTLVTLRPSDSRPCPCPLSPSVPAYIRAPPVPPPLPPSRNQWAAFGTLSLLQFSSLPLDIPLTLSPLTLPSPSPERRQSADTDRIEGSLSTRLHLRAFNAPIYTYSSLVSFLALLACFSAPLPTLVCLGPSCPLPVFVPHSCLQQFVQARPPTPTRRSPSLATLIFRVWWRRSHDQTRQAAGRSPHLRRAPRSRGG